MSYLSRNGHLARLYIGGRRIPSDQIVGPIDVSREEGTASILTCKINPPIGTQDFNLYAGQAVILDVQTSSGITRLFTGRVDLDQYDVINEFIDLRCTDNRRELAEQFISQIRKIGYYSTEVFGNPESAALELENRLTTVDGSYDWDAYGNPAFTSWTPKSTPDYTLGNSDIYRRSLVVNRTQKARVVNSVSINLDYTYQRLHHGEARFTWDAGIQVCEFLVDGNTVPKRELIRDAIQAAGWPLKAQISFTPLFASGTYVCPSGSLGFRTPIHWLGPSNGYNASGISYQQTSQTVVDGSVQNTNNFDNQGNAIIPSANDVQYNNADYLCLAAAWTATQRWSQNFVESYTLSVTAPQSISQYGTSARTETFSLNADFDPSEWEDYRDYTSQPAGAVNLPRPDGSTSNDYVIDQDINRGEFNNISSLLLNRAKTTILASHRENRVIFQRNLWPEIDLKHTVRTNFDKIDARGKVFRIQHKLMPSTGEAYSEVELAFYTSQGSASDSVLSVPTRPTYYPVKVDYGANLQTHYGEDPSQSAAANWTGYVGNKWITVRRNYFRTNFPESFTVDTPAIPAAFRNQTTLGASQAYTVEIPNIPFTITYTGSKG